MKHPVFHVVWWLSMAWIALPSVAAGPSRGDMQTKINRTGNGEICIEAGKLLRLNHKARPQPWAELIIAEVKRISEIGDADLQFLAECGIEIGMNECAIMISLGRPNAVNNTHTSYGVFSYL